MVPWSPGRLATWRGPLPPPLHHRLWPKCLQASSRRRRGCKKVRKTARAGVESVPRQSSRRAPEPARATRLKMKQESFLFLLKRNCLSQPAGPEAPSPPGCRGAGGVLSGIPPSPPALPAAVWARTPEVLGTVWGRCLDGRLWRPGAPAWPRRGEVSLLLAPCTPVAPTVGITAGHRPGPGALCPPPWLAAGALGESVACWEPHGSGSGLGGGAPPSEPRPHLQAGTGHGAVPVSLASRGSCDRSRRLRRCCTETTALPWGLHKPPGRQHGRPSVRGSPLRHGGNSVTHRFIAAASQLRRGPVPLVPPFLGLCSSPGDPSRLGGLTGAHPRVSPRQHMLGH